MRIFKTLRKNTPSVLIAGGAILYYVPATWVERPIEPNVLGISLFGLGGVLLYAGWYDRFDIESDTSADNATYQTPVRTDGNLVAL